MDGGILTVIPSTVRLVDSELQIDSDYANNLRAYLRNFTVVTFACPISVKHSADIARSVSVQEIEGYERLIFLQLPYAYREDRYVRYYLSTRAKLADLIERSDFLLFSPHAKYDWSTLAANLAIAKGRKFGIECDHDHRSTGEFHLSVTPPGIQKIRKIWHTKSFYLAAEKCLSHSSVALLQGQEVFNGLRNFAPNPRKVLNVQVGAEDRISKDELSNKLRLLKSSRPLQIVYAGRMAEMKGPLDWLYALKAALEMGAHFRATWLGEGPMRVEMSGESARLGLENHVALPGLAPRAELMRRLRESDVFLFCHKTGESPRCLGEAMVSGAALVGYGSAYSRDLVEEHGGGEFADTGDWRALAEIISGLDKDRARLAELVENAAKSGTGLDREHAIQRRIDLIQMYLGR